MKKILLAAALFVFGAALSTAQQSATGKVSPEPAHQATPAAPPKPAEKHNPKIAPASVRKGKQVTYRNGTHGKKKVQRVKTKSAPVKPIAPGTEDKK